MFIEHLMRYQKAFSKAKKENLRRFLNDMQDRANEYLEELSANDFHGEIQAACKQLKIRRKLDLYSSNGYRNQEAFGLARNGHVHVRAVCHF